MPYDAGALALAMTTVTRRLALRFRGSRWADRESARPLWRPFLGVVQVSGRRVRQLHFPDKKPDLTVFGSKEPDATNHAYGPGTYNSIDATKMKTRFGPSPGQDPPARLGAEH